MGFSFCPFLGYSVFKDKYIGGIFMLKFYRCKHCGNLVVMVDDRKVNPFCCGEKMELIIPASVDAAKEKHVPEYKIEKNVVKVCVGSVAHPMLDNHYIEWVAIETNKGFALKHLKPGEEPMNEFALADDEGLVAVYAYCNLHGLWVKE